MKKLIFLLLLSMNANFLLAQDGYVEKIEPESNFAELKGRLKNGSNQLNLSLIHI